MKKKYLVSVIIPIYNVEKYLEETIESVVNQTIGFENIQLILVNDGSPDNSEEICLKYKEKYPDNVVYVKQKNAGVSEARNNGIKEARGEFTTFLDSDDLWSLDSFEIMYKEYKKNPTISLFSCKMMFFDGKKGNHPLNYKYKENKIINILEDYEYPQLSSSSMFIKTSALMGRRYDKDIKYSEDNKFINEIIFDEQKMMMLKDPIYYYRKRSSGTSAIQGQTMNIDWYIVTPNQVYKELFELSKKKFGRVIKYIQYLVAYELTWRIRINTKFELSTEDRALYTDTLTSLIREIDDEVIASHRHLDIAKKMFLLKQKESDVKLNYVDDKVELLENLRRKKTLGYVIIDQIYTRNNKMIVYGKLDRKFVREEDFKIKQNRKELELEFYELTNDYNEETYNGETLHDYIGIKFEIGIGFNSKIEFFDKEEWLYPRFKKIASIFSEVLPRSYHHVGNRTIVLKEHKLYCHRRSLLKSFYYELRNEISLLKRKRYKALLARILTKMSRLWKRKELWFISDRVGKAGDNGEAFFKYMVQNHPEADVYFVLTKDSVDYEKMSKIGKVIDPNSNKYKLLFHQADYVVSSHAENYIVNPLGAGGKYIRDQYYFKYIFLQHGIVKDDLSSWLNVNTKKMDMFVTSTKMEYQSLLDCRYYFGDQVVKLTGCTRYDTLLKKQEMYEVQNKIMLSLTWRNSLASKVDKTTGERLYNEEFKNSDYFQFLNRLMTDERLQKVMKKRGYKLRFIPHPNVLCQLEDFPRNEYIEIEEENIDYQKEFCQNKLLITDYSSVFFDFGYLKKPVIYYQADREEFFDGQLYDKGYFEYETMGFGPVLEDYDQFIQTLIEMLEKDCQLDPKYEKVIDETFSLRDDKNCERVYQAIQEL